MEPTTLKHACLKLFLDECRKGRFTEATHLYIESDEWIDLSYDNECAFRYACKHGSLEFVQWLLQQNHLMDMSIDHYRAFRVACSCGHLTIAKWLLEHNSNIDVGFNHEAAFRYSCENGHLHVAKWLIEVRPELDVHAEDDYAFQWSCHFRHLRVAQWIYEIAPPLDIRKMDHWIDIWDDDGTVGGIHREVYLWLHSLMEYSKSISSWDRAVQTIEHLKTDLKGKGTIAYVPAQDNTCSICSERPLSLVSNCGHAYCEYCAVHWCEKCYEGSQMNCAYCRKKISQLFPLH